MTKPRESISHKEKHIILLMACYALGGSKNSIHSEDIMNMPTSEGVVIKDIESTYFIGTKKNPKWIKWKKFVDLDLIVLDNYTPKLRL